MIGQFRGKFRMRELVGIDAGLDERSRQFPNCIVAAIKSSEKKSAHERSHSSALNRGVLKQN
jgi:hypothetical protein